MRKTTVAEHPAAAEPAPMATATAHPRAADSHRRRLTQLAAVAAAAAVVVAAMIAVSLAGVSDTTRPPARGERPAGAADVGARFAGISQQGAALGDPRAPVTLVEFADLQCPFCSQWDREVLPSVLKRIRSGQVRLVLRPLAFIGPDSATAAHLVAAAAQQNKMWPLVDLLYRNQGKENSGYLTEAFQRRIASEVPGLDVDRALAARDTPAAAQLTQTATREAQTARIASTPSFLAGPRGGTLRAVDTSSFDPGEFLAALDKAAGR
jgi:protein-disulfide isomerase